MTARSLYAFAVVLLMVGCSGGGGGGGGGDPVGPPAGDDHADTRALATLAVPGSDTSGELTAGDVDYFRVDVGRGSTLAVHTSGGADTFGRLEDVNGAVLSSNDDGGTGTNFRIERHVPAGTYYIRVAGGGSTGSYTLHVRVIGPGDQHGDTRQTATRVALGSDTPGAMTANDVDWFRIDVSQAGTLDVHTSGQLDTFGHLEDAGGALLTVQPGGGAGGNFRILHTVTAGTYYVRVTEERAGTASDYTLHVRFAAAEDHGDTRADATSVAIGSTTLGELTAADTDYFRISVAQAGTLEVSTSGSTDTVGRLEDAGGTVLATDDDGGAGSNFRLERRVPAGTYYVRVTGGGTGRYAMHVRLVIDDHGDTRAAATAVAVGSDTPGDLTAADTDYFRISVAQAGTLEVTTSSSTDTVGRLEDAGGTVLATDDDGGAGSNFRLERRVAAGTYYVRVTGGSTGRYALQVRLRIDDHGDTRAAATRIVPGPAAPGELTAADTDYFAVILAQAGTLEVYTSGSTDTDGRLEDAAGTVLAADHSGGAGANFRITHLHVAAGTYFVRVTGAFSSTTGPYTLHVRFELDDHGDTPAAATPIGLGSDTPGVLALGDIDYFEITADRAGTLLVYSSGSVTTLGRLEDASGTVASGGTGSRFRIERSVAAGTYYVRVTTLRGHAGPYTLHARFAVDTHGDTRADATPVVPGSDTPGELTAGDTGLFRDHPGAVRDPGGLHQRRHQYDRSPGERGRFPAGHRRRRGDRRQLPDGAPPSGRHVLRPGDSWQWRVRALHRARAAYRGR